MVRSRAVFRTWLPPQAKHRPLQKNRVSPVMQPQALIRVAMVYTLLYFQRPRRTFQAPTMSTPYAQRYLPPGSAIP